MEQLLSNIGHLSGFVIVVVALSALWGITAGVGKICLLIQAGPKSKKDEVAVAPAKAAEVSDETIVAAAAAAAIQFERDEEAVVVISATVAALLGKRHRVVSIRPLTSGWGQQGRREIHASHRIR